MQTISTVVFDIGGVLVELGEFPVKTQWQQKTAEHDLGKWLKSDIAQAFEKGEISAAEFADNFIRENELLVSAEEFLSHFRLWPKQLYPNVSETLAQLKGTVKLAVFSNTNELHWDRLMDEMGLNGKFDFYFASHLLGIAKPDTDAFYSLSNKLGANPDSILFLDDSPVNVDAAISAGWLGRQVQGFNDACEVLCEYKLL